MKSFFLALGLLLSSALSYAAQITPVPDISPLAIGQHIIINIPQQRLFFFENGQLKKVYPVAVGKAKTPTTLGRHLIGAKAFNPTWHIPLSIQKERNDGIKTIPPGPKNPLGPVFVRLGNPKLSLGIHGTNAPSSVPGVRSHGCVRMRSPDALAFAKRVHTGAVADVSYELAALNQDSAGQLWLTAFKDPYGKKNLRKTQLKNVIQEWANAHHKTISTKKINKVLQARRGVPVCLSCASGKNKIQGNLQSIAWNSGSYELTLAQGGMSTHAVDEVLPEGTMIEVNADIEAELDRFEGTSVFD
jgi:hypothetical protein